MERTIRKLNYQEQVLHAVASYLDTLKRSKENADRAIELLAKTRDQRQIPDFTAEAWDQLNKLDKLPASRGKIPFFPQKCEDGTPVPNIVLKIPTGGGKTWLAVSCISRIFGSYLGRYSGFVLWIVPSKAIYTQTLKHLKERQHPYRRKLDLDSNHRVKILEKTDRLDIRDVKENLCVMLLMLQSANRHTKNSLKMFKDRGDVHGIIPKEGDQLAHKAIIESTPNLDVYEGMYQVAKSSLGNALRLIRPVVVLDEGHKAISDLAHKTLYGFNPCFVLELTATPKDVKERRGQDPRPERYANVLVEVTGGDLDREGMIKMPLNLYSKSSSSWQSTLKSALAKQREIERKARELRDETNRYIRPIILIQVERTGSDQRGSGFIHAEDVKKALLASNFREAEIAIKTADQNDLNQPENQDLLSPTNQVRAIITKQALQEGWDCPFAYVLCSLTASSNLSAVTQLIGRILRQPHGLKTRVDALDECHVFTHHASTKLVVEAVKKGLENDGLGDVTLEVVQEDGTTPDSANKKIGRRNKCKDLEIYLPKVMFADKGDKRELDYETDVLSRIDWRGFDPTPIAERIPENFSAAENQMLKISIADKEGGNPLAGSSIKQDTENIDFDPVYAVQMIADWIPNPFVGWDIVEGMIGALKRRNFTDQMIGRLGNLIIEELRKGLDTERDKRAESVFRNEVKSKRFQFRLHLDGYDWRMPFEIDTAEPENAPQLPSRIGEPPQRSLFSPVYQNERNQAEQGVAVYLDGEKAITWWHRNVARRDYGLQGWKEHKIYPDLIYAIRRNGKNNEISLVETKGDHLDNFNAAYKREVLAYLTKSFQRNGVAPVGGVGLVRTNDKTRAALVMLGEWKTELPKLIQPSGEQ